MSNWMIVPSDSDMVHHGRLGQKWGQRNGPPYPLGMSERTYKVVQKTGKAVSAVASGVKKAAKGTIKAAKKAKATHDAVKAKATAKKTARMKKKAIHKNSYQALYDMKDRLTYNELNDAKNRIKLEQEIYALAYPPKKGFSYYTDKISNLVGKFNNYYSTGKNTWNNIAELYNSTESGKQNPMMMIGKGGGKGGKGDQNKDQNNNQNNGGEKKKNKNDQPTIVYNNINPTFYQQTVNKPKKDKKDKKDKKNKNSK